MESAMIQSLYRQLVKHGKAVGLDRIPYISLLNRQFERLLKWYTIRGLPDHPVWIDYQGYELLLNPRFYPARKIYTEGRYETVIREVLQEVTRPGDVAIDVGAHVGHHTITLRDAVGEGGTVYAFEPALRAVSLLKQTVRRNGFANVTVCERAVTDNDGSVTLYRPLSENLGNVSGNKPKGIDDDDRWPLSKAPETSFQRTRDGVSFEVDAVRLDTFLSENDIGSVGVLKIDVEGGETDVLAGIGERLNDVRAIVLEVHFESVGDEDIEELYAKLTESGTLYDTDFRPIDFEEFGDGGHANRHVVWLREGTSA